MSHCLTIPFVALLLVGATSCGRLLLGGAKLEGGLVRDESDKPYYADHWRDQLVSHPRPTAALRQADAYYDSLPYAARSPHRDKVRVSFLDGFFDGFVNPNGEILGGPHDAHWHGFQAGQADRRANPAKLSETMGGFGYTPLKTEGRWTVGFEHSGFRPAGASPENEWWLSGLSNTAFDLIRTTPIPDEGLAIRITGFLSPKGKYGHLSSYDHEFYATLISKKEDER